MRVGVIDSTGNFHHPFFLNKNIKQHILRMGRSIPCHSRFPFTHSEYVCAAILKENPDIEISLYSILSESKEKVEKLLIQSIEELINNKVDIIHMSLGIEGSYSSELVDMFEKAKAKAFIVTASANNNKKAFPSFLPDVVSVSYSSDIENKFILYDPISNAINFSCQYTPYFQLNQNHLMEGNSFLAAKITGILSKEMADSKEFKLNSYIEKLINSPLNIIPCFNYYDKSIICYSNRPYDNLQIEYCKQCLNNAELVSIDEGIHKLDMINKLPKDLCYIDINDFQFGIQNKGKILAFIKSASEIYENIIMRYPILSVNERMTLYEQTGIIVNQFLL